MIENKIYLGNALEILKTFPDKSIDSVITSPPYYQLRRYEGIPNYVWGGDKSCSHEWSVIEKKPSGGSGRRAAVGANRNDFANMRGGSVFSDFCAKCGAWRGQLGLEPTPEMFVEHLLTITKELKRVLKDGGTMFINLGDSYSTISGNITSGMKSPQINPNMSRSNIGEGYQKGGYPPKTLLLVPQRFAIRAVDELGLILRNNIIWAKRNGMPESVRDRFTKKHEFIFFFVKQQKYYFNLDGIRDKHKDVSIARARRGVSERNKYFTNGNNVIVGGVQGLSKPRPNTKKVSQYAVIAEADRKEKIFFRDLPDHEEFRRYIQEKRKESGLTIGAIESFFGGYAAHHWFEQGGSYPDAEEYEELKRLLDLDDRYDEQLLVYHIKSGLKQNNPKGKNPGDVSDFWDIPTKSSGEKHYAMYNTKLIDKPIIAGCPEGGVILDPFAGSGTTLIRAYQLGRNVVGIEGSEKYYKIASERLGIELSQLKLNLK